MASLGYYEETPLFGGELMGIEPISSSDDLDKNLGSFDGSSSPSSLPVTTPMGGKFLSEEASQEPCNEWLFSQVLSEEMVEGDILAELISQFPDDSGALDLSTNTAVDKSWASLLEQLQQGLPPLEDSSSLDKPKLGAFAAGSYMNEAMSPPASSDTGSLAGSGSPYLTIDDSYEASLSPSSVEFQTAPTTTFDSYDTSCWSPGSSDYGAAFQDLPASYLSSQSSAITPSDGGKKMAHRFEPYKIIPKKAKKGHSGVSDKALRKKEQNKTAASRYRQKKKFEQENQDSVCDELMERNKELKEKVGSISREILYLKGLMEEVIKVKKIKGAKGKRR